MKTFAPELRALIIILRSTGPVISTRRSVRSGRIGATVQSRSRISFVSGRKSGSRPASSSCWRSRRCASRRWRSGSKRRASAPRNWSAAGSRTSAPPEGLHGYRALSFEEVAATVRTEPVAPQRFRATITLPDQRLAMYELAGDAFYMDAHILKWHPWANLLGLHTVYELDRVAGRYNAVGDERTQPHTAYELARSKPVDLYSIARRRLLGPLVDAED